MISSVQVAMCNGRNETAKSRVNCEKEKSRRDLNGEKWDRSNLSERLTQSKEL
jgi:hypothetical protein